MDSGVVTKVSGRVVEFFQFHCMDSSSTMLNSHQSSTYHPFNSIVWIPWCPGMGFIIPFEDTFNSIVWIHVSHTSPSGIGMSKYFQFHCMDSLRFVDVFQPIIVRSHLSIPLYGFFTFWLASDDGAIVYPLSIPLYGFRPNP